MDDTVTLPRRDYEALLARVEDAEDAAAVAAHLACEEALGEEKARADFLPAEFVARLIEGEHPVKIWRLHRDLKAYQLAERSGVGVSYLSEIESGKKPGSLNAMTKIAHALDVSLDDLVTSD